MYLKITKVLQKSATFSASMERNFLGDTVEKNPKAKCSLSWYSSLVLRRQSSEQRFSPFGLLHHQSMVGCFCLKIGWWWWKRTFNISTFKNHNGRTYLDPPLRLHLCYFHPDRGNVSFVTLQTFFFSLKKKTFEIMTFTSQNPFHTGSSTFFSFFLDLIFTTLTNARLKCIHNCRSCGNNFPQFLTSL